MLRHRLFLTCAIASLGCVVACNRESAPVTPPIPTSKPVTQVDKPPEDPTPPDQESPVAATGLFSQIDLTRDAKLVAADLAAQWCEYGGMSFASPSSTKDYPPPLDSCAEIETQQLHRHERAGLTATLIDINAGSWESRDLLLLQTERVAALVELRHETADESGEAGTYTWEVVGVELRDVVGSPAPEWIAMVHEYEGDNFEADRCYANTHETRTLIVCSERDQGFACFTVPYFSRDRSTPRPKRELHDCDTPRRELQPEHRTGYHLNVDVRRDEVELDRREDRSFHESADPPHEGIVPLKTLFEGEPIPVGVFEVEW